MEERLKGEALMNHVLDPQTVLPMFHDEKVRMLLMELDMIMEDYKREFAIIYLSANYSSKKHLCSTILAAKHDHEIKAEAARVRGILVKELSDRKAMKS